MISGYGSYDTSKRLFEKYHQGSGPEAVNLFRNLSPRHPGTSDEDMMNLALWLKGPTLSVPTRVTAFYPPMARLRDMYHSGRIPAQVTYKSDPVS